ncbi:hypothetical protein B0O80DRAFT_18442 [Mortierella sp. GBAus27b]|nr:hypothetical protein B0O80DRAFT_18442 [Mortierella sp. GBAus27b]
MQGVIMHPWFRMDTLQTNTLGEPAQDPESARPMLAEELDAEILSHMRWLFAPGPSHSHPDGKEAFDEEALLREIQEKMTSSEDNMEKLFYQLLFQHKTELLENYTENDSGTIPDAPRRRADSFPNSAACSIRSATPEFGRAISPRDSPTTTPSSPFTPITKGADPTPLSLNSEPNVVKEARRVPSLANLSRANSIKAKSRQGSTDDETKPQRPSDKEQGLSTTEHERCHDIMRDEIKAAFIMTPINGSITSQKPRTSSMTCPQQMAIKPSSAAQLPPLHPTDTNLITNCDKRPTVSSDDSAINPTPSIESQVMSTQISENSYGSASGRSVQMAPSQQSNVGERTRSMSSSARGPRPMPNPLDVKGAAGAITTNVSVSQHSRKCSEGGSSVLSTTPLSPRRSWFTRLLDFKPQPLTLRSNVSAQEAQERVETILKSFFHSSIHIDPYKKPAFGVKCRFEGGVIDGLPVKCLKFKVEISEKCVLMPSTANGTRNASTPFVAATISGVGTPNSNGHRECGDTHANSGVDSACHTRETSDSSGSTSFMTPAAKGIRAGKKASTPVSRRASDGGSILSMAAAAVTSHFISKVTSHAHNGSSSGTGYRHSVHGVGSGSEDSPLPPMQMERIVKVTLHQQQGANSTLRMIYDRLCAAWDTQDLETNDETNQVS